ncbi:hypothetical protein J2T13_000821 [Paenibacillus sp. DS2015]
MSWLWALVAVLVVDVLFVIGFTRSGIKREIDHVKLKGE